VGASSRTVRCGRCAGPTFHSCPHGMRLVQRLGNSVGNSHGALALILDRLLMPDISQVGADSASVIRCRRSLPVAVGRCCCCHRCCQPGAVRPVASRPEPCRGWPASGPGRLRPGSWFLSGVFAEVSGVKRDFACTLTRCLPPELVVLWQQSRLGLEGRTRTLSGPSPDLSPARTLAPSGPARLTKRAH